MTINVICAPPNGRNPGMATVDMGFAAVADALALDDVTYWRLFDQSEWLDIPGGSYPVGQQSWFDPDTGLTYGNLRGRIDEVLESGPVVYWGDFHHLAPYHRSVASVLHDDVGACSTRSEAEELVAEHLLLRGRDHSAGHGIASYGSTLLLNSADDYAGAYGDDLRGFLERVDAVHMRDAYSETVVGDVTANVGDGFRGADCAFLLPGKVDADAAGTDRIGVFFARSALYPESLAWFGRRLSRVLGLEAFWVDWGREPAFWPMAGRRRFRLAWPALEHGSRSVTLQARTRTIMDVFDGNSGPLVHQQRPITTLLDSVAACKVVLTDTYHLALNSWRLGTPAICVLDRPSRSWSVNSGSPENRRDKRWDLYSNLDALPLTVDGTRLRLGAAGRLEAERLESALADDALMGVIRRRVGMTVRRAKTAAIATVERVVG